MIEEMEKKEKKIHVDKKERAYIYILECKDGTLYTGWTNHLEERVQCHNMGKGAKYTKVRRPVQLIYYEEFHTKQEAMKREYAIKQLTRKEKLLIVEKKTMRVKERCDNINKRIEDK